MNTLENLHDIYVPDHKPPIEALQRITHLGIGAHQDDLEFIALHGILACYRQPDRWFGGITCTDGGGSARLGRFADYTDEQMMAVRKDEQNRAAELGEYGVMMQLGCPSAMVKDPENRSLQHNLESLLDRMAPEAVYTHNLADKHATHVAVAINVIRALRAMPAARRPACVVGCEAWRDLDWMDDQEKVLLDVSEHQELATTLGAVFESQIAGGKRYDLAIDGRRRANATMFDSHATDTMTHLWFAMDLTPLIQDGATDDQVLTYVDDRIERFRENVQSDLRRQLGCCPRSHASAVAEKTI